MPLLLPRLLHLQQRPLLLLSQLQTQLPQLLLPLPVLLPTLPLLLKLLLPTLPRHPLQRQRQPLRSNFFGLQKITDLRVGFFSL